LIGPKDINLPDHQLVPSLPIRPLIPTSVLLKSKVLSLVCEVQSSNCFAWLCGSWGFLLPKFCNKEEEEKKKKKKKEEHKDGIESSISINGGGK
jgi:hypothetical protein